MVTGGGVVVVVVVVVRRVVGGRVPLWPVTPPAGSKEHPARATAAPTTRIAARAMRLRDVRNWDLGVGSAVTNGIDELNNRSGGSG